jgi:hypothetical protein
MPFNASLIASLSPSLIAFWPFVHAWMLLWGLAALAPIAIHLWSRRRFRETSWAAMEFLLAALEKQARRIRVEQLLLLLLRVAVLILLALALADPQFTAESAPTEGVARPTHWILVVDGSLSMDYQWEGATLFEHAQQQAKRILSEGARGDGWTLILLADPPRVVVQQPAFDSADVIREIDALRLRHTGADLTRTLELTDEIVRQVRRQHPRLVNTRVHILSDLAKTTWDPLESPSARRLLRQLADSNVKISVEELGERRWSNAAVTRVEMLDPFATVDREVRFLAEIRRLSPEEPRQVRVEMLADGQLLRTEDVDLTSGAASVTFSHRFQTPGDHAVQVRLRGDPLEADNHRQRIVMVRDTVRVLCVEGAPGAARFIAFALEPRRLDRPVVQWEIAPESILLESELDAYDMIFLAHVNRFSREEAGLLQRYVAEGGSVAFFLHDQADLASYQEVFRAGEERRSFFPFQFGPLMDEGPRRFDPLDYRHPIVAPFENQPRAGLLTVPTWRYFRLEIPESSEVRRILAFDNGDPALVEFGWGRGRTFLFPSSATPGGSSAGSEFATWPSFPPVIQEMLALAVQSSDMSRDLRVGEPLEGISRESSGDASVTITLPDESQERVRLLRQDAAEQWMFRGTYWSGIYSVTREGIPDWQQRFAVNSDPAESELDRVDPGRLPEQILRDQPASELDESLPAVDRPVSHARWLLAILLVTLLSESFCAWRFGTTRS